VVGDFAVRIHYPFRKRLSLPQLTINGSAFISLNLADAWLTKVLIASGGGEANPLVSTYGADILIKGLLASAIVIVLIGLGKARLLPVLNICMVAVVLWTGGWLLSYLAP